MTFEEIIKKIENHCIEILNDEKAMSGEHLLADDILEIIKSEVNNVQRA